jgi:hypothetical protein
MASAKALTTPLLTGAFRRSTVNQATIRGALETLLVLFFVFVAAMPPTIIAAAIAREYAPAPIVSAENHR